MVNKPGRPKSKVRKDHVMLNIESKLNAYLDSLKKDGLNKSKLVNDLIRSHYLGELCPLCYDSKGGKPNCDSCGEPAYRCFNEACTGRDSLTWRRCRCDYEAFYGF